MPGEANLIKIVEVSFSVLFFLAIALSIAMEKKDPA